RSERCLDPACIQTIDMLGPAGSRTDEPTECLTEAASRFEAVVELYIEHGVSFPHAGQSKTHAARAMIGLKSHSTITFELPASRRWFDPTRLEIDVAQSLTRIG